MFLIRCDVKNLNSRLKKKKKKRKKKKKKKKKEKKMMVFPQKVTYHLQLFLSFAQKKKKKERHYGNIQ